MSFQRASNCVLKNGQRGLTQRFGHRGAVNFARSLRVNAEYCPYEKSTLMTSIMRRYHRSVPARRTISRRQYSSSNGGSYSNHNASTFHYLLFFSSLVFSGYFIVETFKAFSDKSMSTLHCDGTAFMDEDGPRDGKGVSDQAEHFERIPIYRIVLTGGPCAGKSTAMETLRIRLNSLGFQVLTLPELATMFIGSGVKFPQFGPMTSDQILELQSCMVRAQMALEDVYYRLAKSSGEPTLILCDRGVIDGRAYMTPLEFQVMLDTNDWNLMQLRDQRYDCVIHMVSAAIGAESFYTLDNNKARSESLYQAQMIDKKLREVYIGHPYLFVVNNHTGFEEKIEKVVNIVGNIIGMPKKIGSRRKFLVKDDITESEITVPYETINVEHVFLQSDDPNEQRGIRKRTHQYVNSYSIVHKVKSMNGKEETNVFRRLTPKTYMQFMKQADPSKRKIKKQQKSFVWGEHYYVLNRYRLKKRSDVNVLVVEARREEPADSLIPDFLKHKVIKEVTPNEGEEDQFGLHYFAESDNDQNDRL